MLADPPVLPLDSNEAFGYTHVVTYSYTVEVVSLIHIFRRNTQNHDRNQRSLRGRTLRGNSTEKNPAVTILRKFDFDTVLLTRCLCSVI
jgi:hypothetical protein